MTVCSDQVDYPIISFYHINENDFYFLGSPAWKDFIFYFLKRPNDQMVFISFLPPGLPRGLADRKV